MEREPISAEGYNKLREEIRRLEDDEMPKLAVLIADARAEGDLRENAEYHGQRENQGRMQAKINQLKSRLSHCVIVDKSSMPKGVAAFGSVVMLKDLSNGKKEGYELVGPGEEDYDADIMKILLSGPLGQAIQGKKVGDVVELTTPRGKRKLEVTEVK
ncbi:MAG: transcription elongation factor GreA [Planctomycetaceae bacterium]|nr:transcription elongation factor GreA [Planctomycetaceae bacterium]